jgi:hypothetical protein
MNQPTLPPQVRIWQLVLGFSNTAVLHALVKAGVIEQLRERPKSLLELAEACNVNADVLYRTLRFAAVIDVVTQDGEQYALTEMGRLLLKDVPGSLYMGVLLVGSKPWQSAWNNFAHAMATGDSAFEPAMGAGFFEYLDQHPEYGAPYNQWMTTSTSMAARAIAEAYDFTPFPQRVRHWRGAGHSAQSDSRRQPALARRSLRSEERGGWSCAWRHGPARGHSDGKFL